MLRSILDVAERHKDQVDPEAIRPTVEWRKTSSKLSTSGTAHGGSEVAAVIGAETASAPAGFDAALDQG